MSSVEEPHLHLEVGHILFLDIVGYSKLLSDEQKELVQELNQIVRETEQFRTAEAEGTISPISSGLGLTWRSASCIVAMPDIFSSRSISPKTWSNMLTGDRICTTSEKSQASMA